MIGWLNVWLVSGDDGTTTDVQSGILMKEAENIYSLWCSGRTCCEGMLVTLKLLKRQDLVSSIARFFRPVTDQIVSSPQHLFMTDGSPFEGQMCSRHRMSMARIVTWTRARWTINIVQLHYLILPATDDGTIWSLVDRGGSVVSSVSCMWRVAGLDPTPAAT